MVKKETSSQYTERFDGRESDELRPMTAKVGVIPNADGSAMFQAGFTQAYAAVYGPRLLHPRFLQNPKTGILRVHYNMMPFSGHGDRVRPGPSRRSKELCLVIQKALTNAVDLSEYPNAVVDVFIEFPQTDAGTRCAGIVAASMALAHAGIKMKELVSAVAVGKVGNMIVADINYDEEAFNGEGHSTDIATAVTANTNKFSLLQLDGEVTKEQLITTLKLSQQVIPQITELQRKALKEFYE